jgi:hypothetical protein
MANRFIEATEAAACGEKGMASRFSYRLAMSRHESDAIFWPNNILATQLIFGYEIPHE